MASLMSATEEATRANALLEANTRTARQDRKALESAHGAARRMAARVQEREAQRVAAASWWQPLLGSVRFAADPDRRDRVGMPGTLVGSFVRAGVR